MMVRIGKIAEDAASYLKNHVKSLSERSLKIPLQRGEDPTIGGAEILLTSGRPPADGAGAVPAKVYLRSRAGAPACPEAA
jgi:hypothetical protein